ncbi:unnamed protein product [Euphydryas editha]|uniref:Uncharacterized protein n=1 Tax=Euphydryas editha TaxID=104508 RepID=A0AAU9VF93_EUPED|nr:unnamed protein product [Euphydryas editha]
MERRRHLHLATFLFGIIKYKCPPYLYSKLQWAKDKQLSLTTRGSACLLLTQLHHTAAFRGSFRYAATKCWNDLPPPLRTLKTISNFKIKYKNYLLQQQRNC